MLRVLLLRWLRRRMGSLPVHVRLRRLRLLRLLRLHVHLLLLLLLLLLMLLLGMELLLLLMVKGLLLGMGQLGRIEAMGGGRELGLQLGLVGKMGLHVRVGREVPLLLLLVLLLRLLLGQQSRLLLLVVLGRVYLGLPGVLGLLREGRLGGVSVHVGRGLLAIVGGIVGHGSRETLFLFWNEQPFERIGGAGGSGGGGGVCVVGAGRFDAHLDFPFRVAEGGMGKG